MAETQTPMTNILDFSQIKPATSNSSSSSSSSSSSVNKAASKSHSGLSQWGQNQLQTLFKSGSPGSYTSMIDDWTKDAAKQYRINQNDIVNTINSVANQRAAMGIMGGTEANNLRANMLTNLMNPYMQYLGSLNANSIPLKSTGLIDLLGLANESDSSSSSTGKSLSHSESYSKSSSYSPQDYSIVAGMIAQGY